MPAAVEGGQAAAGLSARRTSSASASTRPARRRSRSIARACRWRCSRSFAKNLAAHAWLWKDHTSHAEAAEITEKAGASGDRLSGQVRRHLQQRVVLVEDPALQADRPKVFEAAYAWVELADFVPAFITGNLDPDTLPRGICAAGHKAMYNEQWGGLPSKRVPRERSIPTWPSVRDRYAAARPCRPIRRPAS